MPILIDAWNLIRDARSDIDDDVTGSLEAARLLVSRLERFQKTHSDPIFLVFDSSKEYIGIEYEKSGKLTVIASKNADDYIKRFIDGVPPRQRRNMRVVSSDKEVYYYAKSSYASPVKCSDFWDKINGA